MTRRLRGLILVLAVMAATGGAAGALPGGPAAAAGEDSGVTIEVAAGFDKWIAPNRSYPVEVTVEADRLVRGTIQVRMLTTHHEAQLSREVEVAGGNTETFRFLAPPGQETGFLEIQGFLVEGGGIVARAEAAMQIDPDREVVGLLPDLAARHADLPAFLPLAITDTGWAVPVDVEPAVVDLGPLALEPLDQLVAEASELVALPDGARGAIQTWVERGGQLLVVGDTALLDGVIHEPWRPAAGQARRAGLGQIRSVGEDWPTALLPTPTRSIHEEETIAGDLFAGHQISLPLQRQARAELPAATGLGLLLAVYVLLIGPVVFFTARALRRRQFAWVAVPVLALASTGVAMAGGSALRDPEGSAQVTVYETGPGTTFATTWSLLTNSRGGAVGIRAPAQWTAGPVPDDTGLGMANEPGRGGLVQAVFDDRGRVGARVDPQNAGFGLLEARGPVPDMAEALVVSAQSDADGRVVGTVRNELDVPLTHSVVLVNRTGVADLGTLAPGEEKDFEIEGATRFAFGIPHPEQGVWPNDRFDWMGDGEVFQQIGPNGAVIQVGADGRPLGRDDDGDEDDEDDEVVHAAWAETQRQTGWNYRPPGQVVAVGWSDALGSPVELQDGTAGLAQSSAAVVARATITPAGDRVSDAAVVRSFVRGPLAEQARLPGAGDSGQEAASGADPAVGAPRTLPDQEGPAEGSAGEFGILYAFDLPDDVGGQPVDTSRLMLGIPSWYKAAELWVPGGWQPLAIPEDDETGTPIPAEAVVGGMVFVRTALPVGPPDTARGFVLYEQEAVQ